MVSKQNFTITKIRKQPINNLENFNHSLEPQAFEGRGTVALIVDNLVWRLVAYRLKINYMLCKLLNCLQHLTVHGGGVVAVISMAAINHVVPGLSSSDPKPQHIKFIIFFRKNEIS